jgi:hypothetical protein
MGTSVTQIQHMIKQGTKISINWKMPQINPRKITCKLDILKLNHAKIKSILRSIGMAIKINKLHINGVTQIVTPYFKNS